MTHENRLMELMQIIVIPENGVWKGTLEQLETQLLEDSTYKRQLEKLLYYPTALMTYMRRLQNFVPERVRHSRSDGKNPMGTPITVQQVQQILSLKVKKVGIKRVGFSGIAALLGRPDERILEHE